MLYLSTQGLIKNPKPAQGGSPSPLASLGGCILTSHPAAQGLILAFPKIHFDIDEIYRQRWLNESGQRLENIDQTHIVLASGKLVLQKASCQFWNLSTRFKVAQLHSHNQHERAARTTTSYRTQDFKIFLSIEELVL